jgi:hypothetical protein
MVLRTLTADMLKKPVDWERLAKFWVDLFAASDVAGAAITRETNDGVRTGPFSLADVLRRVGEMVRVRYESPEEAARDNVDAAFVEQIDDLLRLIRVMIKGNSLFVTDSGHSGLGGKEIAVEDRLYVLHQGRTPFVLHPNLTSGLRFRVVSECYVDGLMFRDRSPFHYGPSHVCELVILHVSIMPELLTAALDRTRNTVGQAF